MVVVNLKSYYFNMIGAFEVTKVGSDYHVVKASSNRSVDEPTKSTFTKGELLGSQFEMTNEDEQKIRNMSGGGYRKKLNTRRKRRNKSRKTNKYRFFR
jgi:hypothetical protein